MSDHSTIPLTRPSARAALRPLLQLRSAGSAGRLRAVLATNSATSALVGFAGLANAAFWSDKLGLDSPGAIRVVSAGLLVFAFDVAAVGFRARKRLRRHAAIISGADIAWVIGTIVVLAVAGLTRLGTAVAIVQGVGVAGLAALQLTFRSQMH